MTWTALRRAERCRDSVRRPAEYLDLRRVPTKEGKILGPQLARQRPDHQDDGALHAAAADAGCLLRGYGGTDAAV